ncbi:hypothetical protein [Ralstonia pseudosolanacearum]|uniref:Uncharacterized protein n=1 Tax=Ralstonia solanacearum TaxID=305 RepID=A0A0S4WL89_RALSL|nr:hypothetical protein [Ralstonia pseudosolanacearum]CUV26473.1 protein of unknown function [Ralstonia solanacearum]CUV28118.1 protein of unknown function [Ralstonia solanacearum]CUV35261.1 protein of unknown function [Ralstonia solanacearum]CUV42891.1 protein of unknown function [Ralstonia solanacearum]CUV47565.1 protein of unknown function [Ralstonia solanacearum]
MESVVGAYGGIDILVNNAFDPTAPVSSIIDLSVESRYIAISRSLPLPICAPCWLAILT